MILDQPQLTPHTQKYHNLISSYWMNYITFHCINNSFEKANEENYPILNPTPRQVITLRNEIAKDELHLYINHQLS